MDFVEEAVVADRQLEHADQLAVVARHHAGDQHDEVGRNGDLLAAGEQVARSDRERAGNKLFDHRRLVVGHAQVQRALLARLAPEQLVLAVGAHVAIEVVLAQPGVTLGGRLKRRMHGGRAAVARAVGMAALDVFALAAADAVDVGDSLDHPAVVLQRPGRVVDHLLELRQRDDALHAVAELAGCRLVGIETGGHDDGADVHLDRFELLAVNGDRHLVVAEAAALGHHLSVGEHGDGRMGPHFLLEPGDQLSAVTAMRVHLTEPGDPAAELRLLLHEEDSEPDLGQPESRAQTGDAAADDEALGRRLDDDRLERLGQTCAIDAGPHQAYCLLSRAFVIVGVRPRALLADVHLGVLEGIHAGALGDVTKGDRVELGRARGHNERVEALLVGILDDLLLGRIGAGEHCRPGDHDVGVVFDRGDNLVDVDVVADVAAALADVHADLAAAHACTFTFARSRWAAAWATAAPAWRMESGMSLAPAAEPATNTPGRLVRPGSRSSSASPT